ncbi:MAG: hypothetical protein Q8R82_06765 [Hyphomonadaceae bacterium]|nr:hypothetical protein [Hyphomonadaceae bacterium]
MRPMNATGLIIPAPLRTLWSEARDWVSFILAKFDRATMRTTGIRREHGARLAIWLLGVESSIRRLILTAALTLTPPSQRTRASRAQPAPAQPRPKTFRIFRLHAQDATAQRQHTRRASAPAPYGHIRFPADPLLALGAPPSSARRHGDNGGPRLPRSRAPNPLDRHGRLSRQDPDWRAPEQSTRPSMPRDPHAKRTRTQRAPHNPEALPPSLHDWRRHHDEWQRLIPAPGLAARLDALERIAANPDAAILRTARRLTRSRERALALARAARPASRTPRRVRHVQTAGHAPRFAEACHDALAAHDTS